MKKGETSRLPKRSDIVVIGGGIMGVCVAYNLSLMGQSVVLLEKSRIADQQSGRNWGFIRAQDRHLAELPLAMLSQRLWRHLDSLIGPSLGWRQTGCLYVTNSSREMDRYDAWSREARGCGLHSAVVSADKVMSMMPSLVAQVSGGLLTETDAQAEPANATRAVAKLAEKHGAAIIELCGAVSIRQIQGTVTGVETELGFIGADIVVCCAGATTRRLLDGLSIWLPQQVVRNSVALSQPLPHVVSQTFCGLGLGLRQRADGSCIVTDEASCDIDLTLDSLRDLKLFAPSYLQNRKSFSLNAGKPLIADIASRLRRSGYSPNIAPRSPDIRPNNNRLDEAARRMERIFPSIGKVDLMKRWAGNIDVTPDALPVIERSTDSSGLIIATGFSGHGFGLGPAVGRIVAELVSGATPSVDLAAFSLSRFLNRNTAKMTGTI